MNKLSFDDLAKTPGTRTKDVPLSNGVVTLASVTSDDILEWFRDNDDEEKQKYAGLRMVILSYTNPDGSRIPVEKRGEALTQLLARDWKENDLLAEAALVLNGLRKPKDETKNV